MRRLSRRLSTLARGVPGGLVADIGADHGLLAHQLAGEARITHVFATERDAAGGRRLERALAGPIAEGRASVRVGDGLAPLAGCPLDAVICAGMGSRTIVRILESIPAGAHLLAQPQSEPWRLRRYLAEAGWGLVEERYVADGGRHYLVLHAAPERPFVEGTPRLPLEDLFVAGPLLVARGDAQARALWERRHRELDAIVSSAREQGDEALAAEHERARAARILDAMAGR